MSTEYFSTTFSDARARFLSACFEAGAGVEAHRHPLPGPAGEQLGADIARLGPAECDHVLFVVSATHGIEGYCGSGIQVGLLVDPARPKADNDVALVLIHALNPYGFAWTRRVNEDNVDLNRNFVDHANANYPENELFEQVVDGMIPLHWDQASIARCQSIVDGAVDRHGEVAISKAIRKGQYRHPNSVHFGGTNPTWSNRVLHEVCAAHLRGARTAALVDLHSGLGPYGYGELMTPSKPGEPVYDRFHDWFGEELHSTTAGQSSYAGSRGSILAGFDPGVAGVRWGAVGLEFGTRPSEHVRDAVRADHWLHVHGTLDSDVGREIKHNLRDAFYPEEDAWKEKVWSRGREVVTTALASLHEG